MGNDCLPNCRNRLVGKCDVGAFFGVKLVKAKNTGRVSSERERHSICKGRAGEKRVVVFRRVFLCEDERRREADGNEFVPYAQFVDRMLMSRISHSFDGGRPGDASLSVILQASKRSAHLVGTASILAGQPARVVRRVFFNGLRVCDFARASRGSGEATGGRGRRLPALTSRR